MRRLEAAFEPATLGPIELPNRVIKSATYEGMTPGGRVSDALIAHHRTLASHEVGLTTVAYGAVGVGGQTFPDQLVVGTENRDGLERLARSVHDAGGRVAIQLSHCGYFTKVRRGGGARGPSWGFNAYGAMAGVPWVRPLRHRELREIVGDFRRAAALAVSVGFDVVEIHLGHGYLLSQFISPATNRRRDEYGGNLDNRMRFPRQVVSAVLDGIGDKAAVIAKVNLADGFRGGLEIDAAVEVARRLENDGIHGLVLSGGFTSRSPFFLLRGDRPLRQMIEVEKSRLQKVALRTIGPLLIAAHAFEPLYFLDLARQVRQSVRLPLALLGGVVSRTDVGRAMAEGFDFVAMGRALLADPDLVVRFRRGEAERTRCTACNQCIAEMDAGGVRCVLDGPRTATSSG